MLTGVCVAAAAVLVSWVGWGACAFYLAGMRKVVRPSIPLFAAIGMGVVIGMAGVMACFSAVSAGGLTAMTLAGDAAAILFAVRYPPKIRAARLVWVGAILAGGVAITCDAVGNGTLNPHDDHHAYIVFPKQLVEAGTLEEPFNVRRVAAYGGQQALLGQVYATARVFFGEATAEAVLERGNFLDAGIGAMLAAGMLFSLGRGKKWHGLAMAAIPAAAYLLTAVPHVNTQSQNTGTLLLLGLTSLIRPLGRGGRARSVGVIAGVLAAGMACLRSNYVPAVAVVLGLCLIGRRKMRRAGVVLALVVMVVLVIPWAVVLFRSSNTFYYPLMLGNQWGPKPFLRAAMTWGAHVELFVTFLLYPKLVVLVIVGVLGWLYTRDQVAGMVLLAAGLVTVATGWSFTIQPPANLYRLCSPLLLAGAFLPLVTMVRRVRRFDPDVRGFPVAALWWIPVATAGDYADLWREAAPVLLLGALLFAMQRKESYWGRGLVLAALVFGAAMHAQFTPSHAAGAYFLLAAVACVYLVPLMLPRIVLGGTALAGAMVTLSSIYGTGVAAMVMGFIVSTALVAVMLMAKPTRGRRVVLGVAFCLTVVGLPLAVVFVADHFAAAFHVGLVALALGAAYRARRGAVRVGWAGVVAGLLVMFVPRLMAMGPRYDASLPATYRAGQETVPTGASVLAILPQPVHLDFGRNRIFVADYWLEHVSPRPGIPLAGSPEGLREYLLGQGVGYLFLRPEDLKAESELQPDTLAVNLGALAEKLAIYRSAEIVVVRLGR